MKCQGAVMRGVGQDWDVTETTLDPPREGEVLVKMVFAGIRHSDDHFSTGDTVHHTGTGGDDGGHRCAAFRLLPSTRRSRRCGRGGKVGPGVRSLKPGDHVSFSFIAACGKCRWCVSGMTYLCDNGAAMVTKESIDGARRRHAGGEDITAFCQLGTFAEYAVLAEESVIKLDESIPLHAASLVSCGVTTGWGSGTVGVGTQPGDTVVIVGTGEWGSTRSRVPAPRAPMP